MFLVFSRGERTLEGGSVDRSERARSDTSLSHTVPVLRRLPVLELSEVERDRNSEYSSPNWGDPPRLATGGEVERPKQPVVALVPGSDCCLL